MAKCLDESWNQMRGMEVQSVGIASLSYDEKSQELINTRNEGAMLSDPSIAQGYMVKNMSEGVKNAGSNSGGAMQGFMGVGMGMSTMGNMMNGFTQMAQNNRPDGMNAAGNGAAGMAAGVASGAVQQEDASGWTCECGQKNTGKFCSNCGKPMPQEITEWTCECGQKNTGKFCTNCGKPLPVNTEWTCECGQKNTGKFCSNCGKPRA